MASIKITANTKDVNVRLSNMIARQIPFAVSLALNKTAQDLIRANRGDMKNAFRKPVPFTLNAYYFKWAKKGETSVTIQRKSKQAGRHYLEVQENGGSRQMKGFEKNMNFNLPYEGHIGYVLPTSDTPTNKNGTMNQGFLRRVEAQLKTASDPAMRMNTQKPKRRKSRARQYFVPKPDSHLSPGVYERSSAGNISKKVLNFIPMSPTYKKRTRFGANMPRYAARILPMKMNWALKKAIATARF